MSRSEFVPWEVRWRAFEGFEDMQSWVRELFPFLVYEENERLTRKLVERGLGYGWHSEEELRFWARQAERLLEEMWGEEFGED